MGAYYHLRVLEIENNTIKIRVTIIDPSEDHFYEKESFALQYLWTNNHDFSHEIPPLLNSITIDKILNKEWVVENANIYIKNTTITKTQNYPAANFSIPVDAFFDLEYEKLPCADYKIEVTDSLWFQHLPVGHQWESAAYDMEAFL